MERRSVRRPLRVVHLTLGLELGGQEKLLVEFARHADRERVDLHFVSLTGRGVLADDLEACGWPVTALDTPPGLRPSLVGRLFWLFRKLRADVIHTHDDRPNIYGAPAGRLAGARVVHTRHHQGALLSGRQQVLVRLAAGFTDRFVCVSQDGARKAIQQGVPRRMVRTLPNGIDTAAFGYAGPDPTGPALLVARLSPEKDVETLLRAAALVTHVRPAFRLDVAGDGPRMPDLVRSARDLGLGERVRFLGAVRDVAGLLEGARLFVLSSVTEGVSLTLLEAMARGLPVVATAVGGNVEVVQPKRTGLLVPPRDPQALAEALVGLWDDAELSRRLGLAGRQRVVDQFEVRRMVSAYEGLYDTGRSEGSRDLRETERP